MLSEAEVELCQSIEIWRLVLGIFIVFMEVTLHKYVRASKVNCVRSQFLALILLPAL